jgi:hypothetical protein
MRYTSLEALKRSLDISPEDIKDDTDLTQVLEDASRWVDRYCQRRFYSLPETRVYTAQAPLFVETDDLLSVSLLEVYRDGVWEAWGSGDFALWPLNAVLGGEPYNALAIIGDTYEKIFPRGLGRVRVTGAFGYSTTPPGPVARATLIQAVRLWKRRDAPFGVAGPSLFDQAVLITGVDPDVVELLAPYRRAY